MVATAIPLTFREAFAVVEGQRFPIPVEIAGDDGLLRRSLAPFYPGVATANLTRTEKDGILTIDVVKQAGTKGGANPLAHLSECRGGRNPAIVLFLEYADTQVTDLSAEQLLNLDIQARKTIVEGQKQNRMVEAALDRLNRSQPQPAPALVEGF